MSKVWKLVFSVAVFMAITPVIGLMNLPTWVKAKFDNSAYAMPDTNCGDNCCSTGGGGK